MFYDIRNNLNICEQIPDFDFMAIIPLEDAGNYDIINKFTAQVPLLLMNIHFSRIDIFSDFIYCSINIPEILVKDHTVISFICNAHSLIFIDKNDFIRQSFDKLIKIHQNDMVSSGIILYHILDFLISKDLEKMNAIQQKLAQLERDILNDNIEEPIKEITNYRSSTMKLHHYYVQLAGICGDLSDNTDNLFDTKTKLAFKKLIRKVSLLSQEAQQIWEYTSQIRDVYQQRLDVHQNSIMKVLTIVTTIFMPLTLITGWYGMNFQRMPELSWIYGYPIIIIFSITIIIVLCIVFKKKNWW